MIQGLWDRAEANGYAARVTGDPPPNTPIHDVLLQLSVGDHSIPPVSSEIFVRTAEMTVRPPAFDAGRTLDKIPFFGITETGLLELESTTTVWDGGPVRAGGLGTAPAPVENVPPSAGARSARPRPGDAGGAPPDGRVPAAARQAARGVPGAQGVPRGRLPLLAYAGTAARTGASSTGIPFSTAVPVSGSSTPASPSALTFTPACSRATLHFDAVEVVAPAVRDRDRRRASCRRSPARSGAISPLRRGDERRLAVGDAEARRVAGMDQHGAALGAADELGQVVHPGVVGAQLAAPDQHAARRSAARVVESPRAGAARPRDQLRRRSSILPLAVRSTSGIRGSSAPKSIPCGAASSAASVSPSGSAPKPSP